MSEEIGRLAEVMRRFADDEVGVSSPLYASLARAAADEPELLALLLDAPPTQRRATLFFAAIHHLLLQGARGELAEYFPDITAEPRAGDTSKALREFCLDHADELRALYATHHTQTNEVARATFMLPMLGLVASETDRPLAVIEAGASAGLNLLFDRYFYDYGPAGTVGDPESALHLETSIRGHIPIPESIPSVASRVGVDLMPVDVMDDGAIAWLRACIWPEHAARAERLARAVRIARAAPPRIVRGDAVDRIGDLIAEAPADATVCVFHTSTLAYLSQQDRPRFAAAITEAGRSRDVYWAAGEGPRTLAALHPELQIEPRKDGYALVLAKVGGTARLIGYAGFQGAWISAPASSAPGSS